jgi:hypothetical protein
MAKQGSLITADPNSVEIIRFPGTVNPNATYPAPIPFGGTGTDHFPIGVNVTDAD